MELRIATPEQLKTVYRIHLQEAFPPEELKPLAAMEKMFGNGSVMPVRIREKGVCRLEYGEKA